MDLYLIVIIALTFTKLLTVVQESILSGHTVFVTKSKCQHSALAAFIYIYFFFYFAIILLLIKR